MKIVIAGGGFAGMHLAKKLIKNKDAKVILVDKNNYNFFPPLLYQVSTAFIETYNICYPFRRMFQKKDNLQFHLGALLNIDPSDNYIITTNERIEYDYLILALGCNTNYFGNNELQKGAWPMKSINDALNLRNHLLLMFEKATRVADDELSKYTTILIAGGGPTGVEIAGMLAEMRKKIIPKDYSENICAHIKIYLVDMENVLLKTMSVKAQQEAYEVLKKMGIIIKLNISVKNYTNNQVYLSNGEIIDAKTLIWASGVKAVQVSGIPGEAIAKNGRIMVDAFNRINGLENIFCIGDQCQQTNDTKYSKGHPQLAQVAIQQGKHLAENMERMQKGYSLKPFFYTNKGSMAIIAKYKAVVDLPKGFFKGFLAWMAWLFIHLLPIAGFRNKIKLSFSWCWSFITNDPTLRLIIRPKRKKRNAKRI